MALRTLAIPRGAYAALALAFLAFLAYESPQAALLLGILALVGLAAITPLAALPPLLILAPLRTLISTESNWPFPLDIGQIAFVLVLGWLLMVRIARRETHLPLLGHAVFGLLLLVLAAFGLTVFSAWSLSAWLSEWLKWWVIALMAYSVAASFPQHRLWLAAMLITSAAANGLLGLYIFLGGSGADHLLIIGRFFRAFGSFGQPNPFGGFMGLMLPLALALTLWSGRRWWRGRSWDDALRLAFFSSASLVLLLGLLASWSRGAWIAATLSLLVVAFAWPRKITHSLLIVGAAGLLMLVVSAAGLLPDSIVERLSTAVSEFFTVGDVRGVEITSENYAVIERLAHWQAAWNMAEAHPWLGVGLGNYESAYSAYSLINWPLALGHAHNYYLNIMAEGGMIGLVAYVIFLGGTALLLWRTRLSLIPLNRALGAGLLGSWVYLAVHSLLDNLYVNNIFIHLGVMLGILATLHDQTRPPKK